MECFPQKFVNKQPTLTFGDVYHKLQISPSSIKIKAYIHKQAWDPLVVSITRTRMIEMWYNKKQQVR